MQSDPQKNWHGVVMKWIVVLKDHFTKIVYCVASPTKEPHIVAAELNHICGFIGYPLVYHSDNGNEVSSKIVVETMRRLNPSIVTVTGRPRMPSDQGSVERSNRTKKAVLAALSEVAHQNGIKWQKHTHRENQVWVQERLQGNLLLQKKKETVQQPLFLPRPVWKLFQRS
jgi:hypothetical protein